MPPPRKHRLRHAGALAANSPLRELVTAMARCDSGTASKTPVAGAVAAIGSSARRLGLLESSALTKSFHCCACTAKARCGLSRSSPRAGRLRKFSTTWAWIAYRHGFRRPVGRRCGTSKTWPTCMTLMHRPILCQRHRNFNSISASTGDGPRPVSGAHAGHVRHQGPGCDHMVDVLALCPSTAHDVSVPSESFQVAATRHEPVSWRDGKMAAAIRWFMRLNRLSSGHFVGGAQERTARRRRL